MALPVPGTGTGAQEKVETLLGWSSAPGHSSLLARLLLSGSSQEGGMESHWNTASHPEHPDNIA